MKLKIAVPVGDGLLLGHLGEARQFALVEVNSESRTVIKSHFVAAPQHEPGSFPCWLHEQDVQVLITAGIGQRALDNLSHYGIEVRAGQAVTPVDALATAYFDGQLARTRTGCDHEHDSAAGSQACPLADYLQEQTPGS